jgi:transcriptional regulator with XRE-family HTH domain
MASARRFRSGHSIEEIDQVVDRLREYWRVNYISEAELACRIGVAASSVSDWLRRKTRPSRPDLIKAFLDRLEP